MEIADYIIADDKQLVQLALEGDDIAFEYLFNRYSEAIRRLLLHRSTSLEDTEDLLQETFIKVVRVIDEGRYTDSGKFLSWILRIAHNRVLDHFRRQKSSRQVNESEAGYDVIGTLRFSEPTTEDELVHSEMEQTIRDLVELLPEEQREVVRLRYYSKLSFQEIAEQTEVSINTALGRMRYALINLRRMIKEKNIVLN